MSKSTLYTRSGDEGKTSLVSGTRLSKADFRIDLYGEVDELNSYIGLILSLYKKQEFKQTELENLFLEVQSALFNLGSFLACEHEAWEKYNLPRIDGRLISTIELNIDNFDKKLDKLKNFILPGGSSLASHTHIARCICRRVERKLVEYLDRYQVLPENSLVLLNRLSDFLFVMARYFNLELSEKEKLWVPSK